MKKVIITSLIVVMVLSLGVAFAGPKGNGAPSGPHFNLNLIGIKAGHEKDMTDCDSGNRIFVKLGAKNNAARTDIYLTSCEDYFEVDECMDFGVLDCDGTDDGKAAFMLPDPDPGDDSGCTRYSVYIRALGSPKGTPTAKMTACGEWCDGEIDENGDCDGTWIRVCSLESVDLQRTKGKQIFQNVTKELLTICTCAAWNDIDGDGIWEPCGADGDCTTTGDNEDCTRYKRLYLFDDDYENYLWQYDNQGIKLVQMRFYYEPYCPDPAWDWTSCN
jgi:hypothetical protein